MAREFAKKLYKSKQWKKVREYILMRDKYLCRICGNPAEEIHHIMHLSPENIDDVSIALGEDNLQALCTDCHFKQHSNMKRDTKDEYEFDANGFIVPVR